MIGTRIFIRLAITCILPCPLANLHAQQFGSWIDVAEEAMNRANDPGLEEALCDAQLDLLAFPININHASMAQLESCGLFTSYQVHSILQYREDYGHLLSLYELAILPGFEKAQLKELAEYMTLDEKAPALYPAKRAPGRALFYLGKSQSESESLNNYPGPAWKSSLRIRKGLGKKLTVGFASEKDQGEKLFWGSLPEHLCGYLEWKGGRRLEQLMLGSFRVNNGMGLIQGAGIMHTPMGIHSRPLLLSSLKPYAGASELLMHQGVACRLNLGLIRLVLWSSLQSIDLTFHDLDMNEPNLPGIKTDWAMQIREGGYHRTSTEQAGRSLAYLGSAGIQLTAALGRLNIGLQYSPEINGLTCKGRDSLQYHKGPEIYHASSFQWQWRQGKLELYGEFAPGPRKSSAVLAGGRYHLNDFLSGTIQLHGYGISRRETFASAYASGSHIKNERGMLLLIHAEPFGGIRADAAAEIYMHLAPRSLVNVPASGYRFSLTLQNGAREAVLLKFMMVNTSRPHNNPSELAGVRSLVNIQNLRMDGRIKFTALPGFTWQSRLVISMTPGKPEGKSHAALQQISFRFTEGLTFSTQLVVYQVPEWDNRIYLYEPGLYQQFRFPVYSGSGNKLSILASMKLGRRLNLEARGSLNRKNEIISWETEMQVRLNF